MERVDFYLVMKQTRHYLDDSEILSSQPKILYELFQDFFSEMRKDGEGIDPGQSNLIITGSTGLPADIRNYYKKEENLIKLARRVEKPFFTSMNDPCLLIDRLRRHMLMDEELVKSLGSDFVRKVDFRTVEDQAMYVARIIRYAITRPFVKRDKKTGELIIPHWYAPKVNEYVRHQQIPNPCKYFQGRENELEQLHNLISRSGIVALNGIAGIGKSQLAYAYIQNHRRSYSDIVYIDYSGDLGRDVLDLDITTDVTGESAEERLTRHEHFLRMLPENSLLVIDNMNKTLDEEPYLDTILGLDCRVLITTQCCLQDLATFELTEIEDIQELVTIVDMIHPRYDRKTLVAIIEALNRHTMAVVLVAYLMKRSNRPDSEILAKLKTQKIKLGFMDYFSFKHGGKRNKKTFYEHMRLLFQLYELSEEEKDIMCSMVLIPRWGVQISMVKDLLELETMNTIHDLVEIGLIQLDEDTSVVNLHPIIREMAQAEYEPSTENCAVMIESLRNLCHDLKEHPWNMPVFQIVEEMIEWLKKEQVERYIIMLEDVYECMGKHNYYRGMQAITHELRTLLNDGLVGLDVDRALVLDYLANSETDFSRRVKLREEALRMLRLDQPRACNAAANIHFNIAQDYCDQKEYLLAIEYLETAGKLLQECGQESSIDGLWHQLLGVRILLEHGDFTNGEAALNLLEQVAEESLDRGSVEYARIKETVQLLRCKSKWEKGVADGRVIAITPTN